MNIPPLISPAGGRRGSAVLVMLILLSIMLVLVAANTNAIFQLRRDLKLIERQQVERVRSPGTNAPATGVEFRSSTDPQPR